MGRPRCKNLQDPALTCICAATYFKSAYLDHTGVEVVRCNLDPFTKQQRHQRSYALVCGAVQIMCQIGHRKVDSVHLIGNYIDVAGQVVRLEWWLRHKSLLLDIHSQTLTVSLAKP